MLTQSHLAGLACPWLRCSGDSMGGIRAGSPFGLSHAVFCRRQQQAEQGEGRRHMVPKDRQALIHGLSTVLVRLSS